MGGHGRRVLGATLTLLTACAAESPMQPESPGTTAVFGDGQVGTVGWQLADTIAVRVEDPRGEPVAGVPVSWATTDGSPLRPADTTDSEGLVRTVWTLGLHEGTQTLRALPVGHPELTISAHAITFHATELAGTWDGTCAITSDGRTYCWAPGDPARLVPRLVRTPAPLRQVRIGMFTACGLDSAGQVWCWPSPGLGKAGSSPLAVAVSGLPPIEQLAIQDTLACGLDQDGAPYCWNWRQPGSAHAAAPGFRFAQLSVGYATLCGIDSTAAAFCWGDNESGQLGIGTVGPAAAAPQPVAGGFRFAQISVGGSYVCGLTTDARELCWGWPGGTGLFSHTSAPTPAPAVPAPIGVYAGESTTLTLAADGQLYLWGEFPFGADIYVNGPSKPSGPDRDGPFFSRIGNADYPCALSTTGGVYCAVDVAGWPVPIWGMRGVPIL